MTQRDSDKLERVRTRLAATPVGKVMLGGHRDPYKEARENRQGD